LDFLRKVYTILAAQLGFTAVLSGAFMVSSGLNQWILSAAPWLIWVCFLGTLGALVGLFWARSRPKWSFRALAVFTFFEALSIAMICAAYAASGLGVIVFQACFLTAVVFGALTLYCWQTQRDFSFLGGFLGAALMAVFGAALLNVLLGWTGNFSPTFAFVVSIVSVLLFCGYILYDTSMIIHHLGPDDWAVACISLYLDVLNLFLNLLQILSRLQASSDQ
jgi:FtsH-binding integral membrane protein